MNTIAENNPIDKAALGYGSPKAMSGAHTLQGMGIHLARLAALKGGVKLEAQGMKLSRGRRSCTVVVREMFKVPRATHQELVELLEREIESMLA